MNTTGGKLHVECITMTDRVVNFKTALGIVVVKALAMS